MTTAGMNPPFRPSIDPAMDSPSPTASGGPSPVGVLRQWGNRYTCGCNRRIACHGVLLVQGGHREEETSTVT